MGNLKNQHPLGAGSDRMLAAIVFSDIKGYTYLMQHDERHALELLERFKEVHEIGAKTHNGEIIQYYGDACLLIFKSAYEAVTFCASLQQSFKKEPIVPVRFGVHLGDVIYKDGNVFGDAVNVASRIESLGVSGGVLFSETIFKSIKGHPELRSVSLGSFEFKNVEEPVEVYALANEGFPIPAPEEMQGKLKSFDPYAKSIPIPPETHRPRVRWSDGTPLQKALFFLTSMISLFVLALVLWTFSKDFVEKRMHYDDDSSRVVVFNFENRTNDATLDIIGEMVADRISHSLSKNNLAEVISNEVYDDYSSVVKMSSFAPGDNLAVHKYLSADKMISGYFYKEDQDLIFEANVTNISDGSILKALDARVQSEEDALGAIKELQQAIMGFLATSDSPELVLDTHTPNFQAYRHFLLSKEDEDNQLFHLEKAISIDPNYVEPKLFRLSYYYNDSEFEIADSLYQELKEELIYADDRQRNLLSFYNALLKGENDQVYAHWMREYVYAPFDFPNNLTSMVLALQFVNKPEDALKYYDDVPLDGIDMGACRRCKVRSYLKAVAHDELGQHNRAIREYENLLSLEYDAFYFELLVRSHARRGDWGDMDEILRRNTRISADELPILLLTAGKEAVVKGNIKEQTKYLNAALASCTDSTDLMIKAEINYFLDDYLNAISYLEDAMISHDDLLETLGWLSACYAMNGQQESSEELVTEIGKMDGKYMYGSVQYALARQSLAKGDKSEALRLLKEAVARGIRYRGVTLQNDAFFHELFGSEEFENILNYWK